MSIEVNESVEIDMVYGPVSTDALLVSALDETIGEIMVKDKKEKARKATKTLVLSRFLLFFAFSFSLT